MIPAKPQKCPFHWLPICRLWRPWAQKLACSNSMAPEVGTKVAIRRISMSSCFSNFWASILAIETQVFKEKKHNQIPNHTWSYMLNCWTNSHVAIWSDKQPSNPFVSGQNQCNLIKVVKLLTRWTVDSWKSAKTTAQKGKNREKNMQKSKNALDCTFRCKVSMHTCSWQLLTLECASPQFGINSCHTLINSILQNMRRLGLRMRLPLCSFTMLYPHPGG